VNPIEARFTELVRRTGPRVLGYLTRRTAVREDAADLLSEVFAVAWRRVHLLPDGEIEATAWLFGIARGVLANGARSQRRRYELVEKLRRYMRVDAEHVEPATLEALAVSMALARLGADDRELLTLIAWDGLSAAEVAVMLDLTGAAVRQRLTRARRRFADALKAEGTTLPLAHRPLYPAIQE
jgi:RNA polymerase sigma-70 factor (ECF subfamily)